jgi:hypothetical protein
MPEPNELSTEDDLNNLLVRIAKAEQLATKRLFKVEEYTTLMHEVEFALSTALMDDSELSREYDRERRQTRWFSSPRDGYMDNIGHLGLWRDYIIRVLASLGSTPQLNQQVIAAGEYHTARQAVRSILANAKSSISIFDEYLDDIEVLNIVEPYVINKIKVKLIKSSPKNSFKSDVDAMRKQYGNLVELRDYVTRSHDRLIIIDGTDAYIVGSSLKDIGNKLTTITKLDSKEATKFVAEFDSWWTAAIVVF